MIRSVLRTVLLAFVAQAYAEAVAENHLGDEQDAMVKSVGEVVDMLHDRVLRASPVHHKGLEDTTLGKVTQPGNLAMRLPRSSIGPLLKPAAMRRPGLFRTYAESPARDPNVRLLRSSIGPLLKPAAMRRPVLFRTYAEAQSRDPIPISFDMPKKSIIDVGTANLAFDPLLPSSEPIIVRYELPLALSAEEDKSCNEYLKVVVTKDGNGGEQVGDILRYTTALLGPNKKRAQIFNVAKAGSFDEVVKALVSNDQKYVDDIVMIFERPI